MVALLYCAEILQDLDFLSTSTVIRQRKLCRNCMEGICLFHVVFIADAVNI